MKKPFKFTGPYLSLDQQARMELPLRLTPQQQQEIGQADVVMAVDEEAEYREVVFGRDRLERIAATGHSENLIVKLCPVKSKTQQVECLVAFVRVIKAKRGIVNTESEGQSCLTPDPVISLDVCREPLDGVERVRTFQQFLELMRPE